MKSLDAGKDAPKLVNAFIEIPKGSNVKYEFDEKLEMVKVDRILHTSMVFPVNYGFVPGTLSEDGDALDIMVASSASFFPNTVIVARPIGLMMMTDEAGVDTKVLAVPTAKVDPYFKEVNDIADVNAHTKDLIAHFFSYYKSIEPGKWTKVDGWQPAEKAYELIERSMKQGKKGKA